MAWNAPLWVTSSSLQSLEAPPPLLQFVNIEHVLCSNCTMGTAGEKKHPPSVSRSDECFSRYAKNTQTSPRFVVWRKRCCNWQVIFSLNLLANYFKVHWNCKKKVQTIFHSTSEKLGAANVWYFCLKTTKIMKNSQNSYFSYNATVITIQWYDESN